MADSPDRTACAAIPAIPSRLVSVVWILLLMAGFFLLGIVSNAYLAGSMFLKPTSASAFHLLLSSSERDLHCSPMILEISGFARPGL